MQLSTINENNEVSDAGSLKYDLKALKSVNVDGVMVDCWWGLVEGSGPQVYNWSGYRHLFNIVRDAGLKLQVFCSLTLSFLLLFPKSISLTRLRHSSISNFGQAPSQGFLDPFVCATGRDVLSPMRWQRGR